MLIVLKNKNKNPPKQNKNEKKTKLVLSLFIFELFDKCNLGCFSPTMERVHTCRPEPGLHFLSKILWIMAKINFHLIFHI